MSFQAQQRASDVLDWAIDWNPWLNGVETISESRWEARPTGMTLIVMTDFEIDQGKTGVTVSGGDAGTVYTLTNTITTANALVDAQVIEIYIRP